MTHARWYTELEDVEQDLLCEGAESLTDRQYVLGVLRAVYAEHPWDVTRSAYRELLKMERGWSELRSAPRIFSITAPAIAVVEEAGCNILVFNPKQSGDYQMLVYNSATLLARGWAGVVNEIAREYAT